VMLPQTLELPAAILLVLGGAVACFAGYRLFRVVLAAYGFILGAMIASSLMGITNTVGMVVAAIVGGLVGALLFTFAYYVGIGILGAGIGAFLVHVFWDYAKHVDPPAVAVIAASLVGAVGAMLLQRYVIIVSTAFAGAWTMIVGGLAMAGDKAAARAAASGNVWILYPFTPAPGQRWLPIAWAVLGLAGVGLQLGVTGRRK
jgi:Domain of unknown function (DUF4203)